MKLLTLYGARAHRPLMRMRGGDEARPASGMEGRREVVRPGR